MHDYFFAKVDENRLFLCKIPCLWYANNMQKVLWGSEKRRTFADEFIYY